VMYIGLGSCVSLCFTFGMVVNKFTAGGFLVTRVYNFDLAEQSSVNSQTSGWSDLAGMTRCKARLKLRRVGPIWAIKFWCRTYK
jgi:hypothetical protein